MPVSMYQVSVPVFVKTLGNLAAILDKGAAFAAARKVDPSVLLAYRLAPDMLNLTRQVQIAADHAKRAPARLAGIELPCEDNEEASRHQGQSKRPRLSSIPYRLGSRGGGARHHAKKRQQPDHQRPGYLCTMRAKFFFTSHAYAFCATADWTR